MWDLSHKLILNKDFKFTFQFWATLFNKCDIKLMMTIAYHSFANDQTKRSNQIVKTALRCFLIKRYEKSWDILFIEIEFAFNIFSNASTKISSFEILYDVKSRDSLFELIMKNSSSNANDFLQFRKKIKNNVTNALTLIQTKMFIHFDRKHRFSDFKNKIFLKLFKTEKSKYHLSRFSCLSIKKLKSFFIHCRVFSFAYKLVFSNKMKIHLIIFVIHLK